MSTLKMLAIRTDNPTVENPFPYALDPFQKCAVDAINKEENVLVTAKTGSGKTLVGEYQILESLKKGKRVFYTTPIKSLSNQKFHDLKQIHKSVGILTGDIKFQPQADIVILTTEILRNLLYKQGTSTENIGITAGLTLNDVDAVVFDEVHYVNDPARGKVWEECFVLLPKHIKLVLLSATLNDPEPFAEWLGHIRERKMNLISTEHRVVPLYHKIGNEVVFGPDGVFKTQVYDAFLRARKADYDAEQKHKMAVRNRGRDDPVVKRMVQPKSFVHRMNDHIGYLAKEDLLPALFFVFSRKQCVFYANKVTHDLVSSTDTANIQHILDFHLRAHPELQVLPQYHELSKLLLKGIAFHHSGLLPLLKEIVEILFGRGLIKVLFATETFAVGINMPTKTVVFTSFRKFDSDVQGERLLRTDEYIQMAGRAGRRGKDDKGIVYYLPDREPELTSDVASMMTGNSATVESRMDFHYDFLLKSFQSQTVRWKDVLETSYWYRQVKERLDDTIRRRDELLAKKPDLVYECVERYVLEQDFKSTGNAAKKDAQRKLEAWKNKHVGPRWDTAWKDYLAWKGTEHILIELEKNILRESKFTEPIEQRIQFLINAGFLTEDGGITRLGVLASEINEGHPLAMASLYDLKTLHELSPVDIIANLSCFVEGIEGTAYPSVYFEHIYEGFKQNEIYPSDPSYWTTTTDWMQPIADWFEGGDFGEICQRIGVDAGTFQRVILKVANIVDEWMNLARYCDDIPMLEKMRGTKEQLMRGLVIPDSLYLHM